VGGPLRPPRPVARIEDGRAAFAVLKELMQAHYLGNSEREEALFAAAAERFEF
jgi:hypothetical protein